MTDTTSRAFRLLALLQRRRYWTGAELADRLDVSERTVRRDVERLRGLGYTVHSDRGVDGGYRLDGSTDGAALLLDDDEVLALAVALHSAARGSTELAEVSLSALTKVLSMLDPSQRRRADAVRSATAFGPGGGSAAPQLAVVDVVASACRDHVRLSFDYVAADGAATNRYVEPCQLVSLGARWYLVAYDCGRDDWRTFRLDRVTAPVPARNTFSPRPPPSGDLAQYVRFNLGAVQAPIRVVIEVDVPGDGVRAEFGAWAEVDELPGGRCRVTMDTDSFRWPTHVVAALAAPFIVVSPPEFRRHLAAVSAHLARSTRPGLDPVVD